MHVYGQIFGTLTNADHHKISGTLTIPSAAGVSLYDGPYEVTPKAWDEQVLETAHKMLTDDVTVFRVPYYEVSNVFDGLTAYIAEDTNG